MTAYRTVVVGTDGSDSSLKAVDRAGAIAGDAGAKLVIVCAFYPNSGKDVHEAEKALKDEAYQVVGSAPADDTLQTAADRATEAGAKDISKRPVKGNPVEALMQIVTDLDADLLVVGNRGLNSLTGRLLGSVPSDAARKAECDVLIVHTPR